MGGLPHLDEIPERSFDGILCSAVLMHIPEERLFDSAFEIRRILKPGGRLLVSLPLDETGAPMAKRDENGRLFNGLSPERLRLLLSRLGFSSIGRGESTDGLGRRDRKWVTELFSLDSGLGERSIDRIESVLNRDRKVATYKLALFRALAEIATTGYNQARWRSGGSVALPLEAIAKKWLEYFWPLVSSRTFIPQIQGERPTSGKPIAFRRLLGQLAESYRLKGGLPGFLVASRAERLDREDLKLSKKVLHLLSRTIRLGPVTFAGGGGTPRTVFGFDTETFSIIMDSGLWQELCLMGSWIRDAAILRWAELTEQISQHTVTSGQVLPLLLAEASPGRNVQDAAKLMQDTEDISCVWTGENLRPREVAVDHAIPFSLWHNNDLWNLFPAKRSVNQSKKDKLPAQRVLLARRPAITETWDRYREAYPKRFGAEIEEFAGRAFMHEKDWPVQLFGLFTEAVEITAIQRGCERWEP